MIRTQIFTKYKTSYVFISNRSNFCLLELFTMIVNLVGTTQVPICHGVMSTPMGSNPRPTGRLLVQTRSSVCSFTVSTE